MDIQESPTAIKTKKRCHGPSGKNKKINWERCWRETELSGIIIWRLEEIKKKARIEIQAVAKIQYPIKSYIE